MTTTALMPLDPSVSPQQAARVLTIRADLLPPEIRDGRRARRTRAFVLTTLVLVLAGLGGWYASATIGASNAEDEYNQTLAQLAKVQDDQQKNTAVQKMVKVKNGNTLLKGELESLLARDMSWAKVFDLIRDTAEDTGVEVYEVSGALDAETAAAAADAAAGNVGTVRISGTADNKKEVAEYVTGLSQLTYLSSPFVNTVTEESKGAVSFTVTINITDQGLCGRFTKTCDSGGK
ncbi:PilN domain-containing protein [Actinoplanes sp. NPDC051861]|uniref:PilN domain-containing protein n=1 Tax=Actinoplanes sp. NPDC051861 TaxID=3155170 RepID=UPI00342FABBE